MAGARLLVLASVRVARCVESVQVQRTAGILGMTDIRSTSLRMTTAPGCSTRFAAPNLSCLPCSSRLSRPPDSSVRNTSTSPCSAELERPLSPSCDRLGPAEAAARRATTTATMSTIVLIWTTSGNVMAAGRTRLIQANSLRGEGGDFVGGGAGAAPLATALPFHGPTVPCPPDDSSNRTIFGVALELAASACADAPVPTSDAPGHGTGIPIACEISAMFHRLRPEYPMFDNEIAWAKSRLLLAESLDFAGVCNALASKDTESTLSPALDDFFAECKGVTAFVACDMGLASSPEDSLFSRGPVPPAASWCLGTGKGSGSALVPLVDDNRIPSLATAALPPALLVSPRHPRIYAAAADAPCEAGMSGAPRRFLAILCRADMEAAALRLCKARSYC